MCLEEWLTKHLVMSALLSKSIVFRLGFTFLGQLTGMTKISMHTP